MKKSIHFSFGADNRAFALVAKQTEQIGLRLGSKINSQFGAEMAGVKASIAGMFTVGAITAGASAVIDKFSRVQDVATRFRESAESVQRVGFAAEQSGADMEMVARAMSKLTIEARNGGQAFGRVGIDAQKFVGMSLEEKIMAIAGAYTAAGEDAGKLADIQALLGNRMGDLLPLLSEGEAGIRRLFAAAPVAANATVAAVERAGDSLDEFKGRLMVVGADALGMIDKIAAAGGRLSDGGGNGWANAGPEFGLANQIANAMLKSGEMELQKGQSVFDLARFIEMEMKDPENRAAYLKRLGPPKEAAPRYLTRAIRDLSPDEETFAPTDLGGVTGSTGSRGRRMPAYRMRAMLDAADRDAEAELASSVRGSRNPGRGGASSMRRGFAWARNLSTSSRGGLLAATAAGGLGATGAGGLDSEGVTGGAGSAYGLVRRGDAARRKAAEAAAKRKSDEATALDKLVNGFGFQGK